MQKYPESNSMQRDRNAIHIFADISDTQEGAQGISSSSKVKLNVGGLTDVVTDQRPVARKVAIGSISTAFIGQIISIELDEKAWRDANYETIITQSECVTGIDQGPIDSILAAIQVDLLTPYNSTHTLVLLTGNGSTTGGKSSFPKVIQDAILRGWDVEVWAWERSISPSYTRMVELYSPQFIVRYLDSHIDRITVEEIQQPATKKQKNNALVSEKGKEKEKEKSVPPKKKLNGKVGKEIENEEGIEEEISRAAGADKNGNQQKGKQPQQKKVTNIQNGNNVKKNVAKNNSQKKDDNDSNSENGSNVNDGSAKNKNTPSDDVIDLCSDDDDD